MFAMAEFQSPPLPERLHEGIERLASLERLDQRRNSGDRGVTPTQAGLLHQLMRPAKAPARVQALAHEMGLSQPTVTDSLLALERKGLIARESDPQDGRAVLLRPTDAGRSLLGELRRKTTLIDDAIAALSRDEQAQLLELTVKMIRSLLDKEAMPVQRMCVTCRHFRPRARPETSQPHYCEFVKAAFASDEIRLDCGDHDAAPRDRQAATWRTFLARVPGSGQNQEKEKIE